MTYSAGVWSTCPESILAEMLNAFQLASSWGSDPVRKSQRFTMLCAREYPSTSDTVIASGLASIPSS